MLTVKGKKFYASLIGFIEVLIWFLIVREALNTEESGIIIAIAYALGYATGTFIGGVLSNKFIQTPVSVQIITKIEVESMITVLKNNHYGCSVIDVTGHENTPSKMIIVETMSKRVKDLTKLVNEVDDKAFIVISETKYIQNGYLK